MAEQGMEGREVSRRHTRSHRLSGVTVKTWVLLGEREATGRPEPKDAMSGGSGGPSDCGKDCMTREHKKAGRGHVEVGSQGPGICR